MQFVKILSVPAFLLLSACVQAPATPADSAARQAAAAEFVARNCTGYTGGFSDVRELRAASDAASAQARELGASDGTFEQARADVQSAFTGAEIFVGRPQACAELLSELAWALPR